MGFVVAVTWSLEDAADIALFAEDRFFTGKEDEELAMTIRTCDKRTGDQVLPSHRRLDAARVNKAWSRRCYDQNI